MHDPTAILLTIGISILFAPMLVKILSEDISSTRKNVRMLLSNTQEPFEAISKLGIEAKIIRKEILANSRIINKINQHLSFGCRIEEIVMRLFIYDIALHHHENAKNPSALMLFAAKIPTIMKVFRLWQAGGKVTSINAQIIFDIIGKFILEYKHMYDIKNAILEHLDLPDENNESLRNLLDIILLRISVKKSLHSIGVHNNVDIIENETNEQFCINASLTITRKIIEGCNFDIRDAFISPCQYGPDIVTTGIFLFTISAHLTTVTKTTFEPISAFCFLQLFREKVTQDLFQIAVYAYNKMLNANPSPIKIIGEHFVNWIEHQDLECFERLIQLYHFTKSSVEA